MLRNSTNILYDVSDINTTTTQVQFITLGICSTILAILGLIGNIISLVILSRPQMHSTTSSVLKGVALFDIIVLISTLLMLGLPSLAIKYESLRYYKIQLVPMMFPAFYTIANISHTGSTWGTIGVTVERYVVICHPLRARSLCTQKRAQTFNVFLIIFSVCINLPRIWEYGVKRAEKTYKNETFRAAIGSELNRNRQLELINKLIYLLIVFLAPCLAFIVFNGLIFKTLRVAAKSRRCILRSLKKDAGLFLILVCVGSTTIFCNVIRLVLIIWEFFQMQNTLLVDISDFIAVINSSVNFLIYSFFGQKFRRTLKKTFCMHISFKSASSETRV